MACQKLFAFYKTKEISFKYTLTSHLSIIDNIPELGSSLFLWLTGCLDFEKSWADK